jgi:hypothetical protein
MPQKKVPARKASAKSVKKGDVYECNVCGLAVRVDTACGCVDTCDIICCDKEMKKKRK